MADLEHQERPFAQGPSEEEVEEETEYRETTWRDFVSWRYVPLYLVLAAMIALVILVAADKNKIVSKLTPIAQKIKALPAGWLIPVVLMIVVSIPPLFGHEIIALLCGVVYGLGIGFGVVAAGTVLGEMLTWFFFKTLLRKRAYKLERTNLNYAALARLIRDGGLWIICLVRLSVVPGHMATAVFSTCDVKFWHFTVGLFFGLPKQIIVVYIGTLLAGNQSETKVKAAVFVIGFIVTGGVSLYVLRKLRENRKFLLQEQEQRRLKRRRDGDRQIELENRAEAAPLTAGIPDYQY